MIFLKPIKKFLHYFYLNFKNPKKHKIKNLALLFAFLFNQKEDIQALERLKIKKEIKQRAETLLAYKHHIIQEDSIAIKMLLKEIGYDCFMALLELKKLEGENTKKLYALTQKIMIADECFCLKDLQIKGDDLQKLGFEGKEIGKTLELLLEKVIKGELENSLPALKHQAIYLSRI